MFVNHKHEKKSCPATQRVMSLPDDIRYHLGEGIEMDKLKVFRDIKREGSHEIGKLNKSVRTSKLLKPVLG